MLLDFGQLSVPRVNPIAAIPGGDGLVVRGAGLGVRPAHGIHRGVLRPSGALFEDVGVPGEGRGVGRILGVGVELHVEVGPGGVFPGVPYGADAGVLGDPLARLHSRVGHVVIAAYQGAVTAVKVVLAIVVYDAHHPAADVVPASEGHGAGALGVYDGAAGHVLAVVSGLELSLVRVSPFVGRREPGVVDGLDEILCHTI